MWFHSAKDPRDKRVPARQRDPDDGTDHHKHHPQRDHRKPSRFHMKAPWHAAPHGGPVASSVNQSPNIGCPLSQAIQEVKGTLPKDSFGQPTVRGAGDIGLLYNIARRMLRIHQNRNLEQLETSIVSLREQGVSYNRIRHALGVSRETINKALAGDMEHVRLGGGHTRHFETKS